MRDIDYLVVHCSATRNSQNFTAEDVKQWHLAKGWNDIGYHYVIEHDGTVTKGRPEEQTGAHVKGYNTQSIGICLMGGISDDTLAPDNTYTDNQLAELYRLLKKLQKKHARQVNWANNINQVSEPMVLGHRDFPGVVKACPCFDVKPWYKEMKAKDSTLSQIEEHIRDTLVKAQIEKFAKTVHTAADEAIEEFKKAIKNL
jgi:N-acetylmuramoyl-L-alanine amidase